MPLIEDYIELQEKYEKKYGDKTIVLYECGQFFEIYGVVNEEENFGKIYDISELTTYTSEYIKSIKRRIFYKY